MCIMLLICVLCLGQWAFCNPYRLYRKSDASPVPHDSPHHVKRCQKQKHFVLKGKQAEVAPKRRVGEEQRPPLDQVQRLANRRTRGSKGPGDKEQTTCFICLSIFLVPSLVFVLKTFVCLLPEFVSCRHIKSLSKCHVLSEFYFL